MCKSLFVYCILLLLLLLFYSILSPAQKLENPIILMLRAKWQDFCSPPQESLLK